MDDIKEGSLVRAVKGSNVIEGVVTAARFIGDTQWQLGDARSFGYTVTVVEEPSAPALPTKPGWYVDKDGDLWDLPTEVPLEERFAPYTRLVPLPEVIDHLVSENANGWLVEAVREHFGVSS